MPRICLMENALIIAHKTTMLPIINVFNARNKKTANNVKFLMEFLNISINIYIFFIKLANECSCTKCKNGFFL